MIDKDGGIREPATDPTAPTESVDLDRARLRSGRVLGDRYRIEGVLGRGGMGEVWRACEPFPGWERVPAWP